MQQNLPDRDYFLNKTLPGRSDVTIIKWVDGGSNAHLFQARSETLQRDLACKIIPRSNLSYGPDNGELWRAEVQKADVLRNPSVVRFEDIRAWKDDKEKIDCVVLIAEFIEGPSLKRFIKEQRDSVDVSFIVDWLQTMLNLLNEMKLREVKHGDLHTGNILVEDRSSYDLLGPQYVFRITDFGVTEVTSDTQFKDDYQQLADLLRQLLNIINYPQSSPKDKYVFTRLQNSFIRHLMETDLTHDSLARQPANLLKDIQGLDTEFEHSVSQASISLITPFDFLSCEQIGDAPALLNALYSDRFLGLSEIESQNNVVVTGPRGCGKTTVFRSLSLDQKRYIGAATPDQTRYIGVYYRCDDLFFSFPRYTSPNREEALDIPIHFVTATLVSKLLDSVEAWGRQYFSEDFVREEPRGAEKMWELLDLTPPSSPGYATFKAVISRLNNRERAKAVERQRFANDQKRTLGHCFGPDVLPKICEMLSGQFSFLRERPIYFFIDDYSAPKVSKELQANLNRVFMQRWPVCFFKLSTESPVSFVKYDVDGKIYVESREFLLQNLGLVYLHAKIPPKLAFIEDVFRRRLKQSQTNFSAQSLEDLVGKSPKVNNNEMARQIRKGKKPDLFGKEILCNLCSGDIHYLISLVGNMVALSGTPQEIEATEGTFKILQEKQNQAIREEAGRFLKNLQGIPKYGAQLVSIVESFGNIANSHLKYLTSGNEGDNPPKQASRIEPYEPLSLSSEAQQRYDELLRYSVFIEDFRGKSRRGHVVPRLYMRRFLIPHFNLTFSTRDSIELEPTDFELFLLEPKSFENKLRLKSEDDGKMHERRRIEAEKQMPLGLDGDKQ